MQKKKPDWRRWPAWKQLKQLQSQHLLQQEIDKQRRRQATDAASQTQSEPPGPTHPTENGR